MTDSENVMIAYTVADAVAEGRSKRPFPKLATEAGFNLPVALTGAAYADVVAWTRTDAHQDEEGRFWDVLITGRRAAQRAAAEPGRAFGFHVHRVANTINGRPSRATLPRPVALTARIETYDRELTPCVVIALPDEN